MATIILSSIGSLFGPVGQIAGTFAGNAIDNALFAPDAIEGPRLKELAVTRSSYGTPVPKLYGKMRVAGTMIWSTDFEEQRELHSNGKGKPKTAQYSYSVSFAVLLSSRPIDGLGRIWADGNLLRGTGGDLKSGGTLRIHSGHADQRCDPLLEAELGDQCPAFRGQAYVVFEGLDLTDFGNRIPGLSFEVFAGDASTIVGTMLAERGIPVDDAADFPELEGYAHDGAALRDVVQLVDRLHPLSPRLDSEGLRLTGVADLVSEPPSLPPAAAWDEGDFGSQSGRSLARKGNRNRGMSALRYYDPARNYQPGVQHAENDDSDGRIFQFPGALEAGDALSLARRANVRDHAAQDSMSWRCAELDPEIIPGSLVTAPGIGGIWVVAGWEWRERGVELELQRHRTADSTTAAADAGNHWTPPDQLPSTTLLRVFETPWDGFGSSHTRTGYAAAHCSTGRWSGCALYANRDGALIALGQSATQPAISGQLASPLGPSHALRYEPDAVLQLALPDSASQLQSSDLTGLAQGVNRLLVGGEVIQFCNAIPQGNGMWTLSGLLRGRGGTEPHALKGHPISTPVTLLDDRLVELAEEALTSSTGSFAAIGLWDEEAVEAALENAGSSLEPPCPVHTEVVRDVDGSVALKWVRRGRGQWLWRDEVATPLVEESESYEVGIGPLAAPLASWAVGVPRLELPSGEISTLEATHGVQDFWVRQLGTYAKSKAALIGPLT